MIKIKEKRKRKEKEIGTSLTDTRLKHVFLSYAPLVLLSLGKRKPATHASKITVDTVR